MGRETAARRAHIPDMLLVLATLLLAALLIWQCADIYFTGVAPENQPSPGVYLEQVYSREIVAARFGRITWAFWLWLAAFAATCVRRIVRPDAKPAAQPLPVENLLEMAVKRAEPTQEMLAERKKRRTAIIVCAAVCAALCVPAAVYLADRAHFTSRDLEAVMGEMLLHIGPWVLLSFAALMALEQFLFLSRQRELAAAKQAPRRAAPERAARKNTVVNVLRIVLLLAAAGLIAAGVSNGGMRDVLIKAINICTECIGLG